MFIKANVESFIGYFPDPNRPTYGRKEGGCDVAGFVRGFSVGHRKILHIEHIKMVIVISGAL